MLQVSVSAYSVTAASRQLRESGRKIDPVLRGALNTTATKTRAEQYVRPLRTTVRGKRLRQSLVIKRANRRWMQSRIIPSSAGIKVSEYSKWGYDPIDATRARIWVMGPNGRKIAAGFVNPSSAGKKPLRTRSEARQRSRTYTYSTGLTEALGPSAAYWFRQLSDGQTVRWVNRFLQQEFERRVRRELLK